MADSANQYDVSELKHIINLTTNRRLRFDYDQKLSTPGYNTWLPAIERYRATNETYFYDYSKALNKIVNDQAKLSEIKEIVYFYYMMPDYLREKHKLYDFSKEEIQEKINKNMIAISAFNAYTSTLEMMNLINSL